MNFFSKSTLVVVAAMFGAAQANWGYALLNGTAGVATQSCGTVCHNTNGLKVALPTGFVNPHPCCATITIAYAGKNLEGTYTDDCTTCQAINSGVDGNIVLSPALYAELDAPTPYVTWNVVGN